MRALSILLGTGAFPGAARIFPSFGRTRQKTAGDGYGAARWLGKDGSQPLKRKNAKKIINIFQAIKSETRRKMIVVNFHG
jgi:hypothetical protein